MDSCAQSCEDAIMKKLLWILPVIIASCATEPDSETTYAGVNVLSPEALKVALVKPDFVTHVKPILEAKCAICHNQKTLPKVMNLDDEKAAFKPAASGHIAIIPFHPEQSLLINNIRHSHSTTNAMPPVGERLTKDETSVLKTWIAQGAAWPEGRAGRLKTEPQ